VIKKEHVSQVFRFAVVGGTVMVCFVGLVWLFGHWLGRQASFLLAYPPTLAMHFSLNKWWTFGCQRTDTARQVSEYLVMVVVTFIIQWVVFTALGAWTSLPAWVCAGAANAAQMAVTFLMMRQRVFAGAQA
jgi:putative flippase GtrA